MKILKAPQVLPLRRQLDRARAKIDIDFDHVEAAWAKIHGLAVQAALTVAGSENSRAALFGRGATTWRVRDEVRYQSELRQLAQLEKPNIVALQSRISRRLDAAEALARRLGVNEPWAPSSFAVDRLISFYQLFNGGPGPRRHVGATPGFRKAALPPPDPP